MIGFGAGLNARLTFRRGRPDLIARRVNQALGDREATAARAERARTEARSPKYHWDRISRRYVRVYVNTPARRSTTTGPGLALPPPWYIFATQPPWAAAGGPDEDEDDGNGGPAR